MKNPLDINWKSRTVWTGIFSVCFGISGYIWPDMALSQSPDILISIGLAAIFLKS